MKLEDSNVTIERYGDIQETEFSIADINLFLEYMRKSIYSNPIRVVCQEIMSNARDAHRELGKPEIPIVVKLPNALEPTWECRDFGPGIDPERMKDVFIKFGASTKRIDNEQTGGFGIGAKTPWAYTDTFVIRTISNENGVLVKREYSAIIAEDRSCKLVEFDDGVLIDVNDPNIPDEDKQTGTTIVVEAKQKDFKDFVRYTTEVGAFWNPQPKLIGANNIDVSRYICEDGYQSNYLFVNSQYILSIPQFCLVDSIPYKIDYDACNINPEVKGFVQNRNNSLVLKFNTGDITLAISREQLQYDNKTKDKINQVINNIVDDVIKDSQAELDKCKTLWEATAKVRTFCDRYNILATKFSWNGKKLECSQLNLDNFSLGHYKINGYYIGDKRAGERSKHFITPDTTNILVLRDTQDRITERMDVIFEKNPYLKRIYYLKTNTPDKIQDYIFCKLSDIQIPDRQSKKTNMVGVYELKLQSYYYSYGNNKIKHNYTMVDANTFDGVCLNYQESHSIYNSHYLQQLYNISQIIKEPIYAAAPTNYAKLKKKKSLEKVLDEIYNKIPKEEKARFVREKSNKQNINVLNLCDLKENNIYKFYQEIGKHDQTHSRVEEYHKLLNWLYATNREIRDKVDKLVEKLNVYTTDIYNKIVNVAPLLPYIGIGYYDKCNKQIIKEIEEYIQYKKPKHQFDFDKHLKEYNSLLEEINQ